MNNVKSSHLVHITINIISFFLLIIACILIFIQSIKNIKYNYTNDKTILAEKIVYQQFSHDVYSNINSKIIYDFETVSYDMDCPEDKEILKIPIKLDSYYDCENIKNGEIKKLNKNICQNKISKSSICCLNECCEDNIFIKQTLCREKNINNIREEESNDIRNDICTYFNIYNGKISNFYFTKLCVKRYEYNYEYLLYLNENTLFNGEDCMYFDTKNHIICDKELKTRVDSIKNLVSYASSNNIIVKNIISEIKPNFFEYETLLKESILNNKIKITKKEQKNLNKYKILNIKNIYNAFFKNNKETDKTGNKYYRNLFSNSFENLLLNNKEKIFENYLNNEYLKQKNINWYTRNYIGFQNYDQLKKFQQIFDENDPTNNPLYKISNIIYPNWETIIIIILFFLILIFIFYLQLYDFIIEKNIKTDRILRCNSYRQIITMILLIIYLTLFLYRYVYQFKKIEIDMEIYYKIVLEKYNERRAQKCLLIGIILLCVNFIIEIINYLLMIYNNRRNGINPISKYTIICTLRNSETFQEHKFKFYLNRKFSEEMKRFKEKFFENFDIDECNIENSDEDINYDKTIKQLNFNSDTIILVTVEQKYN